MVLVPLVLTIIFAIFFQATQVMSAGIKDPYFGLRINLPPDWKVKVPDGVDDNVFGYSGKSWKIVKNPMTYVTYQVINQDIIKRKNFEKYKNGNFSRFSASMQSMANKVGAKAFNDKSQTIIGGQTFETLTWILQAPNRPQLTSTVSVGSLEDKAVAFGYSCTGADCLSASKALQTARFTGMFKGSSSLWNFTIPKGWEKIPPTSQDEKLSIIKGEDNSLSFSLIEDDSDSLENISIAEIKMELFNETLTQFRSIAEENGLKMTSEEEEVVLGKQTFQVLSIGLVPPAQEDPVYVVGQMVAAFNNKLAMILVTCVDERTCNEIQQAIVESTF